MITYNDVKLAVNTILINEFNKEVIDSDVEKGFSRPSFSVLFDNILRSSNETQIEKSFTVRIYYFPSDKHKANSEIMGILEQLEYAFDLKLSVKDRLLNVVEVNSVITDGVLDFSFDLEFSDGKQEMEYPLMDELDFQKGVK